MHTLAVQCCLNSPEKCQKFKYNFHLVTEVSGVTDKEEF